MRMGFPSAFNTSPASSKVTFKYPRYFPKANAWTTGTFLPSSDFTINGYGPAGTSVDGGVPAETVRVSSVFVNYIVKKLTLASCLILLTSTDILSK